MGILITAIIIVLILCLRVSVRIGVRDELSLVAGVGFIRLKIFPTKEKKLKLSDYRIDKFRKRLEKEKSSSDRSKKSADKPKKDSSKPKASDKNAKSGDDNEKRDIPELISKLTRVVGVFLKRFGKHLRIDMKKFNINIAAGDAASTAILWGASIGAAQNLYALLVSSGTLRTDSKSEFTIVPDYLSERPSVEIDLRFSFMLWQLFDMAIRAGIEFLKKSEE